MRRLAQFRGAMRGTLPTVLLAFAWPVCAQSISGTVVDAHSDSPLDGATVVLVGTLYATAADSAGTFTLGPLPVGSYDMEVWRHGYLPSRQRVTLTPDRDLVTSIRLRREYRETPLPASVGHVWRQHDVRRPLHEAIRVVPAVQIARRSIHDYAPVIRGMHAAQVDVNVDGMRSTPGSPYGPTIQTLILPYEMEVVTGPYALTWGQNAFGAIRVRTPFQHVVAAEAGYGGSPRRYRAAAVVGRIRRELAYEFTGSYDSANGYLDHLGNQPLTDLVASAVRGRARLRHEAAEVVGWAGYQGRAAQGSTGVYQADAGARFAQSINGRMVRNVDMGASWQQRSLSGWPYSDSRDSDERQIGAHAILHFSPVGSWRLIAGTDMTGARYDKEQQDQVGVFAYGSREANRARYSGAVRVQGISSRNQPLEMHLSAAAAAVVSVANNLRVSGTLGSAARPAGVYERHPGRVPYARMPLSFLVDGSATLRPERVFQVDLGLHGRFPGTNASLGAFVQRMWGQIDVITQRKYTNTNGTFFGCEASLAHELAGEFLQFTAGAAYIQRRSKLPLVVAPLSAGAGLVLQAPANLFALDFQMHAGTPSRVEIFQGSYRVPGHLTLDAHLRVALSHKLLLTIGTSNITGERYGWHASGLLRSARVLEEPGRQWTVRLRRGL